MLEVFVILVTVVALAWPLGRYLAVALGDAPSRLDRAFAPLENLFCRLAGIDPKRGMSWRGVALAFVLSNAVLAVIVQSILMFQHLLPLNPDGIPGMSWDLALHTMVSFLTNTNQQHYSGQAQLSYFSQLAGIVTLQIVTPAMGLAIGLAVLRGLFGGRNAAVAKEGETRDLGNFYVDTTRCVLRVFLPLMLVWSLLLTWQGVPSTLAGAQVATPVDASTGMKSQTIPVGPVAPMVAIKQLGTNGGGWYGPNSAVPLENPTPLSNLFEMVAILLMPVAIVFMIGRFTRRPKLTWLTLGVMGAFSLAFIGAALRLALTLAVTFLGLLLITFLIGRVVPIDPVLAVVGDRAPPDVYERARIALGLHLPLWRQFLIYLQHVLQGDFGTSVLTSRPVIEDILRVFPATLELATVATILGVLFGVPMGIAGAVWQGRWPDHLVRVLGLVGYSVPVFWLGLMGLLLFYAKLGWVEGPGRLDVFYEDIVTRVTGVILIDAAVAGEWDVFWNALSHVILPASILGYFSLAYIARMTRSLMLEQLRQEYIVAARAKGVPEWRIVWSHALRNTAVPLITVIALSYGGLLEGSVITETVFAWPGLGAYLTGSLLNADMNAVLGATIVVGTVFIGLNLLSDLLYRLFDPRARA